MLYKLCLWLPFLHAKRGTGQPVLPEEAAPFRTERRSVIKVPDLAAINRGPLSECFYSSSHTSSEPVTRFWRLVVIHNACDRSTSRALNYPALGVFERFRQRQSIMQDVEGLSCLRRCLG